MCVMLLCALVRHENARRSCLMRTKKTEEKKNKGIIVVRVIAPIFLFLFRLIHSHPSPPHWARHYRPRAHEFLY